MRTHLALAATLAVLTGCSGSEGDPLSEELAAGDAAADAAQRFDGGTAPADGGTTPADSGSTPLLDAGGEADANIDASASASDLDASLFDAATALDGALPADSGSEDAAPTLLDATLGQVTALLLDFETPLPESVNAGTGVLTPSQGYAPLGSPGNTFGATFLRGPTSNTVTITVNDLPAHSSLSIDFLFAAIDSLDGTGAFPAGDFFRIDLDGQVIFRESFSNATLAQIQSYAPPPGVELARRVNLGFGGPDGYYTDSAYDMGADPTFDDLPHGSSTAQLTFTLEGEGVQDLNDESWAIDNVRITTGHTPRTSDGGV